MPLALHLSIHFLVAIIVGCITGLYFKKLPYALIAALIGGFFIDIDHVIEYYIYYGPHFNLSYFLDGRQFLMSDKIYLIFHAWEYAPILFLIAWLLRKRKALAIFIFTLALAGTVHLVSDVLINHYPLKFYSISYRTNQNFSTPNLLTSEEYQKNIEAKGRLGI